MIFPTTFILTLFLIQVGRVVAQSTVQGPYKAVYDPVFDNKTRTLNQAACSNLIGIYPTYADVPGFPFIGGAPNTSFGSPNCGQCWKITNVENNESLYFMGIDYTASTDPYEFNLSIGAFRWLGGNLTSGNFTAAAELMGDTSFCANQQTY